MRACYLEKSFSMFALDSESFVQTQVVVGKGCSRGDSRVKSLEPSKGPEELPCHPQALLPGWSSCGVGVAPKVCASMVGGLARVSAALSHH